MHAIMYTRESHEKYNHDSKREKSFLEIRDDYDKKGRECHMTRRERRVRKQLPDSHDIWMYGPRSRSKYASVYEECFKETNIYYESNHERNTERDTKTFPYFSISP